MASGFYTRPCLALYPDRTRFDRVSVHLLSIGRWGRPIGQRCVQFPPGGASSGSVSASHRRGCVQPAFPPPGARRNHRHLAVCEGGSMRVSCVHLGMACSIAASSSHRPTVPDGIRMAAFSTGCQHARQQSFAFVFIQRIFLPRRADRPLAEMISASRCSSGLVEQL